MGSVPKDVVLECTLKLKQMRSDLLNRMRSSHSDLLNLDVGGDEADQTVRQLTENSQLAQRNLWRERLLEIEMALARIETGSFGLCEETEEPIEVERLLAIPYTRLSIEGAEIREALARRRAK